MNPHTGTGSHGDEDAALLSAVGVQAAGCGVRCFLFCWLSLQVVDKLFGQAAQAAPVLEVVPHISRVVLGHGGGSVLW